jgi:excisionase family DNA binding protein
MPANYNNISLYFKREISTAYNRPMEVTGDDRILTLIEAAALIGRSPQTLYLQARRGRLRAEKHGGVWLVRESEVRRYEREVLGRHGFAASTHPLHGNRSEGRRGDPRDPET